VEPEAELVAATVAANDAWMLRHSAYDAIEIANNITMDHWHFAHFEYFASSYPDPSFLG
jgi:hypothetical protein